jgi:hypothetical protein
VELEVKGKSASVAAYRLLHVDPDSAGLTRHLDSPLVGRDRELQRLRDDFEHAVTQRSSHLFTLLGAPGVGKSRLVEEFVRGIADHARMVRGRCLHYGEGITYWPLVEVLLQLGADAAAVLALPSPSEAAVATRKLLETQAAERPLVVVWDDIQWAEPTFLDLIEHVADWSRGAPIFLLCVARPELLAYWLRLKATPSSSRRCCSCSATDGAPTSWSHRRSTRSCRRGSTSSPPTSGR